MILANNLNEIVSFNSEFRNAINLYLNLNNKEKVLSYIPTKSSVNILKQYLDDFENNTNQATFLIGPYGKGKSHLLLVLLAIVSMERNDDNKIVIQNLIEKIEKIEEIGNSVAELISTIWNDKNRVLPVIISSTQNDLNQAFLLGINDALKREGITNLIPDTYYSYAISNINEWSNSYLDTFEQFKKILIQKGTSVEDLVASLKVYDKMALELFIEIYPQLTSGSKFNPLVSTEILPLYRSINEKLHDEYGFSGIYIVFDEFSKFIEAQNKKIVGNNMKLLQDLCELANDSKGTQLFITMVAHKSIKEYGKFLTDDIINSFTGIEGRLQERLFVTSFKNNYELIKNAIIKNVDDLDRVPQKVIYFGTKIESEYYNIPMFKSNFVEEDFNKIILKGCYPLNPISAYLLLNVSEKVAQNERTLFTFISKDEQYSMANYVKEHTKNDSWIVSADLIYDYFSKLFKKEVSNEFVHNEWLNAEYAISKCATDMQRKVLKTLAIINIVNKEEELPANEKYLIMASNVLDGDAVIEQLINKKLIYKKGSTGFFVFKTRAGSELKSIIKQNRTLKGDTVNIANVLTDVSENKFILPRRYNQRFSMTRFFIHEFMNVDDFLEIENASSLFSDGKFCDGKVITLFTNEERSNSKNIFDKVREFQSEKLVIVYSETSFELQQQAQDYEIIQELKQDILFLQENEVLGKELYILEEDIENEILLKLDAMYGFDSDRRIIYFYDGKVTKENKNIENAVDSICFKIYMKTPIINNELINRENISTAQIKKARKTIIDRILTKQYEASFYDGTSSEATIFRSLFLVTHIIDNMDVSIELNEVLEIYNNFIDECGKEKQNMTKLINKLISAPYAIRRGIIPIYFSYILSQRKEDIIVYFNTMEVQVITTDIVLNMCEHPNDYYIYVSKSDIEKEKYISELQKMFDVDNNLNLTESRINNIFICMQRWFRSLPQVTRSIKDINEYFENEIYFKKVIKIKNMLATVEANPFDILFIKLRELLSQDCDYREVINELTKIKKSLENYYQWLLQITVNKTVEIFDRKHKNDLVHTLKIWYEQQSNLSKKGLYSSKITGFMSCIASLKTFDDLDAIEKIVKSVSDVYIDSWNDNSLSGYIEELIDIKKQVEAICDSEQNGKYTLTFTGKNDELREVYYDKTTEGTGAVLRNIIEDALDDYSDMNVNDKVAILLEMIEKVIK